MASMLAEHFLYFNYSRFKGDDLVPVKFIKAPPPPGGLGICRSKVVILLLLICCLLLLPLWKSVIGLCFVLRYFISILVLQSS